MGKRGGYDQRKKGTVVAEPRNFFITSVAEANVPDLIDECEMFLASNLYQQALIGKRHAVSILSR